MFGVRRRETGNDARGGADTLFARIGTFLADHGLSADPAHYAFAHDVVADPGGELATAVARLTEGGVRLARRDIEALGGKVAAGAPVGVAVGGSGKDDGAARASAETAALAQAAREQVADFGTMMAAMRDETRSFGRDLAAGAAAMEGSAGIDAIARVTGAMLARVRDAETRLAQAMREAEVLRSKLDEANDTARRDALTGLPNRRAFDEAFARRDEAHGPYCLALCDVDRFKRINDEHGHAVGDRVLSAVAATLAAECGPHLVVRHGGEEFAILLAGLTLTQAADELDRIRAAVAAKRFRTRDTDRPLGRITVSVGLTAVHTGESAADTFARADLLLYAAKADGRDRVHAA